MVNYEKNPSGTQIQVPRHGYFTINQPVGPMLALYELISCRTAAGLTAATEDDTVTFHSSL
ncbi:MAG TPA: hypothetical protein VIU13_05410 [Chryseolinea sp.]